MSRNGVQAVILSRMSPECRKHTFAKAKKCLTDMMYWGKQKCLPPEVVFSAQLDVGTDDSHLDGDQHCQGSHHKAEAEDVVEEALYAQDSMSTEAT